MLIAHGIFGQGQNWRSIARKLCAERPRWGVVLVDLRAHGQSTDIEGADTVSSAAADIVETADAHGRDQGPVRVLLGHSFGGKVVLAASAEMELERAWIVDASPSATPGALEAPTRAAPAALAILEEVEATFALGFGERGEFVAALAERGVETGVGQFLAMNLQRNERGRFVFAIDLARIRALLTDYFAVDLWNLLERESRCTLEFAVAGRDSALSRLDTDRLVELGKIREDTAVHRFDEAGHWIHADAPERLVSVVATSLTEQ